MKVLLIAILLIVPALADTGDYAYSFGSKRVIVEKGISILDRAALSWNGCTVRRELGSVIAADCPQGARIGRPEKVFSVDDLQADMQINADDVWSQGYTGDGVVVAVLDTGVDTDHPELADSIAGGMGFGYAGYEDDHGHGTHVAGIITSNGNYAPAKGAAPGAQVWAAKVCSSGGQCWESDIIAAIEHVVNNNVADIISLSLGGPGTTAANCDGNEVPQVVNWAVANGVTVVAAAGNNGASVSDPACASGAIAVGAVNFNDVRQSWSGQGDALDIMAPGASILSTYYNNRYAWMSGTSMSTPHVSAVVALLRSANPSITDAEIKSALYGTAKDLGAPGLDAQHGWGRVDAFAALVSVAPVTTTTTSTTTTSTTTSTTTTTTESTTTTSTTTTSTTSTITTSTTASTTTTIITTTSTVPTTIPSTTTTTTDTTTTSTTTTTESTTTTTLQSSVIFSDSFESGVWPQDIWRDWRRSAARASEGSRSAEVDGWAAESTMEKALDLSAGANTLSYSWLIEPSWDSGEYICLDIFANGAWANNVRCLDGNVDAENVWHEESVDLAPYATGDFRMRFRARVSSSSEDGYVDDVVIAV